MYVRVVDRHRFKQDLRNLQQNLSLTVIAWQYWMDDWITFMKLIHENKSYKCFIYYFGSVGTFVYGNELDESYYWWIHGANEQFGFWRKCIMRIYLKENLRFRNAVFVLLKQPNYCTHIWQILVFWYFLLIVQNLWINQHII